jgi:3-oxoacyl-(acyl-carrier-protein) synthase
MTVTGCGHVIVEDAPCDPTPYLKAPKLRKYMGVQDDLAVVAAARALESAHLQSCDPERIGLYLAVGYIPFEQSDLDPLLDASLENGRISMERFSTAGFRAVNGLLTFRCLPNMPAFHISVNCNIQGPYFVTYPGPGQFYLALEEAVNALREKIIDVALVGGVANQRNFLVEYHHSRLDVPIPGDQLRDAAGCIVLERASSALARGANSMVRLTRLQMDYQPQMLQERPDSAFREGFAGFDQEARGYLGAASLAARLSIELQFPGARQFGHVLHSRDGFVCSSNWERA